jgi:hypothetical protein
LASIPDLRRRISMRRVGAWELVSLDGIMERPENWAFSYSDEEMGEASASGMARSDALLLGRVTYEHMAAYWPHQAGGAPMVDYINSVPKFVVSATLEESLEWNNSTVIGGNAAEEIAKLKRRPGKDITVLGWRRPEMEQTAMKTPSRRTSTSHHPACRSGELRPRGPSW